MPRRKNNFSDIELALMVSAPTDHETRVRHHTFSPTEREWIDSCRGDFNRLGFAVQLAYMKYPSVILQPDTSPDKDLLEYVAEQIGVPALRFQDYAMRPQTRREHISRAQQLLGIRMFGADTDHGVALSVLQEKADQGAKGMELAEEFVRHLRQRKILLPGVSTIRSVCAEVMTLSDRRLYDALLQKISDEQRTRLDALLLRSNDRAVSDLTWLRRQEEAPCTRNMLALIERLKFVEALNLPEENLYQVSRNRLKRLARIAATRRTQNLAGLEERHRHACLAALLFEMRRKLKDKMMEMHIAIIGGELRKAKQRAKADYLAAMKEIKEHLWVLAETGEALDAEKKRKRPNAFAAITKKMPWAEYMRHVAQARLLCQNPEIEQLSAIIDSYHRIHRYAGPFLEIMPLRAHPTARDTYDALQAVKRIRSEGPVDPKSLPVKFIKPNWRKLVLDEAGINVANVRYYEICAMVALKEAATRGDIFVEGSRHFSDFKDYFLTPKVFEELKEKKHLGLSVPVDFETWLKDRIGRLSEQLRLVNRRAKEGTLPGVHLAPNVLKISPLESMMPIGAKEFNASLYGMLPKIKITDLLIEVQQWINFAQYFTHGSEDTPVTEEDMSVFLTVILSHGINLGIDKMSDVCAKLHKKGPAPITSNRLNWIQDWYVRDECYKTALVKMLKAQHGNALSKIWGDGTTSASDGLRLETAAHASKGGNFSRRHGPLPGRTKYGNQTDRYGLFGPKMITSGHRDATHVLDALLELEPEWRINEHYTDTLGYTDLVFGLCPFYGYKFSPRIRNFHDNRLYVPPGTPSLDHVDWLVAEELDIDLIRRNWDEVLRLAASIKHGVVTASLMLRKLGAYPRQTELSLALREIGRLERSLFMLEWVQDPDQRRKTCLGLNKYEASNALKRAVFVHRGGDLRDRTLEDQQHRACGLTLVCAAIVLWNTVYLERAVAKLNELKVEVDPDFLSHLSPQVWGHISLSGDYVWPEDMHVARELRPLRPWNSPRAAYV